RTLVMSSQGDMPVLRSSAVLHSASCIARAFFALCIAQRLLTRSYSFNRGGPQHRYLLVYTHSGAPYPFQDSYEFPLDVSDAIDRLTIDTGFAKVETERRKRIVLKELKDIGAAMALHSEDDRLLRAAQW